MSSPTSTDKLAAAVLAMAAVLSPLFINRRSADEEEEEDGRGCLALPLPLLLIILTAAITLACFVDHRFTRFDPYWIHRVGGSSFGIFIFLAVLGFVLKFKTSLGS